ncbi:MAG: hypothetical protein K8T10_14820 [Candidatus Eremiobacteraeota bacterium]|nr:hypothetical protein [Candidatus Eremiobacteraeota bacterium]
MDIKSVGSLGMKGYQGSKPSGAKQDKVMANPKETLSVGNNGQDSKMKNLADLAKGGVKKAWCATGEIGGAMLKLAGFTIVGIALGAIGGAVAAAAGGPIAQAITGAAGGVLGGAVGLVAGYKTINR